MQSSSTGTQQFLEQFGERAKQAHELWLRGDARHGIPAYESLLADAEGTWGTNAPFTGLILFRIGFLHAKTGDFERAMPRLERSLGIIGPLPDEPQNLETKANLYWGLGMGYRARLQLDRAINAFQEALSLKSTLRGADDPELVQILTLIADLKIIEHRLLEAIPLLERALVICEKAFGPESVEAAQALASLGNTRSHAGEFQSALGCLLRCLEIREKLLGPTNVIVGISLYDLGSLYLDANFPAKAVPLLKRSVELLDINEGTGDVELAFQLASALNHLGLAQVGQGDHAEGISTLQRSLGITETHFGGASINLVKVLNTMAVAYKAKGDFERAFPLLERAMRIVENAPLHKAEELVDCINNLAELYRTAGDDNAALRLFNRSLEVSQSTLGVDHVSLAYSLNGIALIAQERRNTSQALAAFARALAVLERSPGSSQGDRAGILNNMSMLLASTGETNRALSTLQSALALQEGLLPPNDPAVATTLNNLGVMLMERGKFSDARSSLRRSIQITDAAFGKDNPESCVRLDNFGMLSMLDGDWVAAFDHLDEAARRRRRYLAEQMAFRHTDAVFTVQEQVHCAWDWCHSMAGAAQGEMAVRARVSGAEQSAIGKALLAEVESASARLAADSNVQVRSLRERADSILRRLESLARTADDVTWIEEREGWRASERDGLESELRGVEGAIAEASEWVRLTIDERDQRLCDVARCLSPDAALVDFVQYRRTEFCCGNDQWKEQRYGAYVTFPASKYSNTMIVERVDLCETAPIDDAVATIVRRMSAGQYAAKDLSAALQRASELVYGPLASYLTNISHLIICPDGQLSRLPFEMLSHDGRFLIEEKTITYVGSGREVVRLTQPSAGVKTNAPVVMGNPDFDLDLASSTTVEAQATTVASAPGQGRGEDAPEPRLFGAVSPGFRSLSRDYRGLRLDPLPGAEAEARETAKLLGGDATLRLGAQAREAELKAVVSPRVLHLSTHGFFLSDQEFKRTNNLRDDLLSVGDPVLHRRLAGESWENPMIRCGLALAGANHATQITNALAEDGLLTGLEAALLNLQGTELVVLSACDSGSGDVKIGEGVMSLRRAFRIAGAQTVLASHWKVNDRATARLMTEFMRRWQSGEPRGQAWRQAQLSLLRSPEFSNPYFWAAFTLTGQWR